MEIFWEFPRLLFLGNFYHVLVEVELRTEPLRSWEPEKKKHNFRASCVMSADARLSIQYDGFGGLVVGEVRGNSLVT